MFEKLMDSWFVHLLVLAIAVGAVFLGAKAAATQLPSGGFAGSVKHVISTL